MKTDILAAIDIGSNAVRFLINYLTIDGNAYSLKKASYLRIPIRLGEDVFSRGHISTDKARRLLMAMQGFTHIAKAFGVSDIRACATSAMRDAKNGQDIAVAISDNTGIELVIIDGEKEAELVYMASFNKDMPPLDGPALFVDVGGGSTELVLHKNGKLHCHDSFRLGTVRMLSYKETGNDTVLGMEKQHLKSCLSGIHDQYAPKHMVASGGNINKTHKLLGKKSGEPIRLEELTNFLLALKPMSIGERMRTFGLNDYRADVIVPALEIFLCILEACPSIRKIHVPKIGLADGLIHELCRNRLEAGFYN